MAALNTSKATPFLLPPLSPEIIFSDDQLAQAETTFTSFSFAATEAPTARTMPARLSNFINVKDWAPEATFRMMRPPLNAINYAVSQGGGAGQVPFGFYEVNSLSVNRWLQLCCSHYAMAHFETLADLENCEELAFAVTAQTIPKSDNNLQPVMPMARAAGRRTS